MINKLFSYKSVDELEIVNQYNQCTMLCDIYDGVIEKGETFDIIAVEFDEGKISFYRSPGDDEPETIINFEIIPENNGTK